MEQHPMQAQEPNKQVQAVETYEGWFSIHSVYEMDYAAWFAWPEEERKQAIRELLGFQSELEGQHEAKVSSYGFYEVAGGKGDMMWWFLQPTLEAVTEVDTAFKKLAIAKVLTLHSSFVSVVEVSNYMKQSIDHPKVQERLRPAVPRLPYVCFYPMSKRRNLTDNWYRLPWEERRDMMRSHGRIGRTFEDTIKEITTSAVGLDDWEWGITLMSADAVQFKKIVYAMRFDEVSARFGMFGPFTVGSWMSEERLRRMLSK